MQATTVLDGYSRSITVKGLKGKGRLIEKATKKQ